MRAVLLDLDDTILDDTGRVNECWQEACRVHAGRLAPLETPVVIDQIRATSKWFWDDVDRHRQGRLALNAARCEVVRLALEQLGVFDAQLANDIGQVYSDWREQGMAPLPDAIETVRWLRDSGHRLALLTNGSGPAQRKKIVRFGLTALFDSVLVEGELGFGKPDERVYRRALDDLGVTASQACMVGDNLEWDVAAPQREGIAGIWIDRHGAGVPRESTVRPHYVVRSLSDLRFLPPLR